MPLQFIRKIEIHATLIQKAGNSFVNENKVCMCPQNPGWLKQSMQIMHIYGNDQGCDSFTSHGTSKIATEWTSGWASVCTHARVVKIAATATDSQIKAQIPYL